MMKYFLSRWYAQLRSVLRRLLGYPVIYNANKVNEADYNKRALLVYLVKPFLLKDYNPAFLNHTNFKRCRYIATILGEFGFILDVVNYDHNGFRLTRNYDLVIGLGRTIEQIVKKLSKETIKIYLATGSEANFFNQCQRKRIEEINQRRSRSLKIARKNHDDSNVLEFFDAIICLGNEVTASTYRPYFKKKIYLFNNHGHDRLAFLPKDKNYEESRRNFLFLTGSGKVLNGLDLLLEVFERRPNLNLYVCGSFTGEEDFVKCYEKELYETPNIFTEGWITIGSEKFNKLIEKCGIIIVPVCAGASHGSVVVCMNYGLIPVVTKEAGIDVEDFGITFSSYKIKDIEKVVDWIPNQSEDWHREHSIKTREVAVRYFSRQAFIRRWREIISEILKTKRKPHD